MGFVNLGNRTEETTLQGVSLDFVHKNECAVCPLNRYSTELRHPNMAPSGTDTPLIYGIGEAPGKQEDDRGRPFVGRAGQVLHFRIPPEMEKVIRWNNCVRTRPPKNRTPTPLEIECCRPSVEKDIVATQPKVIFGFGGVPLRWATGQSGISIWRGRKLPIKVGEHACWFYPMFHPSYIQRERNFEPSNPNQYGSENEFAFALDLKRAFAEVNDLPEPIIHSKEDALSNITTITGNSATDLQQVLDFLNSCYDEDYVGLDYETNCLRPFEDNSKILSVAISKPSHALSFPLYHRQSRWTDEQLEIIQDAFTDFLYHAPCTKISFSLDFELVWSAYFYGREVVYQSNWGDAQAQAFLLDPRAGGLSLAFLTLQYFGIDIKTINNLDTRVLDATSLPTVLQYNGLDAKYHLSLFAEQWPLVKKHKFLDTYDHHIRRIKAAALTQLKGVPIDQEVVAELQESYEVKLADIERGIASLPEVKQFEEKFRTKFKPSSTTDVLKIFHQILHLFDIESTDEKVLSKIKHPLAEGVLNYRTIAKMISTYVLPVTANHPKSKVYSDGYVHPVLNCNKVVTSRTSSEDPNIQNWPNHDDESKEVRRQVKSPRSRERVVAFDYAGIQARNVAMESGDTTLVKVYWERYDIHGDWLDRLCKRYPSFYPEGKDPRDKEERKYCRNRVKNGFVFPSLYGAQPKSISLNLGVPEDAITKLWDEFWAMFPDVKKWQEGRHKFYRRHGYVTGASGYRRYAPVKPNEIINTPIQADEAILVCNAMSRLSETGDERLQPNLMVHDDFTYIWDKDEIDELAEIAVREMLTIDHDWVNVPMGVEMKIGNDWESVKRAEEFFSDELGLGPIRQ